MKNTATFFIVLIFTFFTTKAQEKTKLSKDLPMSIYTFNNFQKSENSFVAINKKLNLSSFNFVYANQRDLDNNDFSVYFNNIGKKPSAFIYDDYKRYQDNNLLKGFLKKNDPTRWNLHRIQSSL